MTNDLPLAAEFPPATRDDWMKLVEAAIKGAPFERTLVCKTYDDLRIEPVYERVADAAPVVGRAAAAPWQIVARVDHPDPAAANAQALHDLENGATGLSLVIAGSSSSYGFGLAASEAAIGRALDGIHLDAGIAVEIDAGPHTDAARLVAALVKRSIKPAAVDIRFGFDPLAASSSRWSEVAPRFAAAVCDLADEGFAGPFAVADARPVHDAGGSEAQELALALALGVAYLRALEAGGVALGAARGMIFFRLVADADQFLTTAKLRALRKLWARVEQACGLTPPRPAFIAATTAWRMMTRRDPYVNILRTTIAAFSAGLGGADAISVLPFTQALGLPDGFARRIARNTQLILIEESNLARVADPAAGSGGLENLTHQLCGAAWGLFQEIEAAGGAAAALERGLLQDKVAAVRSERQDAIAYRRDPLTGVSEFPDISETRPAVLDVAPLPPARGTAWPQIRLAEPFEALRDASDRMLAATGTRPRIFLANLGTFAEFTARATFAKNFFEAGGIEAVGNDGFAGLDDMVAALGHSGARLACLCSTNEVYAREASAAARALIAAGAHVYLAGRPGEHEETLRTAGVAAFIFAGCNALATLEAAHRAIAADTGDAQGRP
jgi:methylmalonyl-CoA mutase